jgi:hypothetical protein
MSPHAWPLIDGQYYLTIAAAPISLLVLVLGFFAVRRENRALTFAFMTLCVLGAGYFAFKVRARPRSCLVATRHAAQLLRIYVGSQVDAYLVVRKSLTVFCALATLCYLCS